MQASPQFYYFKNNEIDKSQKLRLFEKLLF